MQVYEYQDACDMKRDMDLIRELLIQIEQNPMLNGKNWMKVEKTEELGISGRSLDEVAYHLNLLIEAGLLKGQPAMKVTRTEMPMINKLTWQGHEFLDDIRDQSIWAKTKERIAGLQSIGLTVVGEIAKAEIKKHFGLF